ncbi:MAG: GNAT family N-acetyltransferase [Solirubrobacteraceae bacterium]
MTEQLTYLPAQDAGWRAFADAHATSPLQQPSWFDVLLDAYRRPARVAALLGEDNAIAAILPMLQSKLPWRRTWTALPYTDVFEPLALSAAARQQLLGKLASAPAAEPIILRAGADSPGWTSRELGSVQVIDVSGGAEAVLRQASSATRRNVKRARRPASGLVARPISSAEEFVGSNLWLMSQTRRRLGTPTQPKRYWARLWDLHAAGHALTIGVYLEQRLVASGVFVAAREHAVYKYGASDASTWELRPNFLMFATAFDELAARGIKTMDFGVTDAANASLRDFKARWGGEERAAHYSATDERLLPATLEPGRLLTRSLQRAPAFVGRGIGTLAYPFVG